VDEIYNVVIVQPVKVISTFLLWKFVDVLIIDGIVNGTGRLVQANGIWLRRFQSGYARAYGAWILFGAVAIVAYMTLT
jgi:NADH-quinone oxidoreductase subunit L